MKTQYDRSRYKEWFELGEPAKKEMDANGNLVEYYLPQKVSLHYAGANASNSVEFFSHFAPSMLEREKIAKTSPQPTPPPSQQIPKSVSPPPQEIPKSLPPPSQQARVQNRQYYETGAKQAFDYKDFQKLRLIIDEGLTHYPDSATLWSYEGAYYFSYNESGPQSFRREKALKAAKKAVDLEPVEQNYFNLGQLYHYMFKDYSSALNCYEKAGNYGLRYPRAYYYMAICYEELKHLNLAISYYEKFLKAAPNDQYAQDARNRLARLR
jgi:tetratricopeptide (TPR) repeat protein